MAITDKLNDSWTGKEQAEAVFRFRAEAQNCYMVMAETLAALDGLADSSKFTTVDAEIKAAGAQVRKIINDAKVLLDGKLDFINWAPPKEK